MPRRPLIRQRILSGTSSGTLQTVEVDRPTILDPYGDPNYGPVTSDSAIKGFWVEYGFPGMGVEPVNVGLIPSRRGRVYLWQPGLWAVRVRTQTAGPQPVYFREIGVEDDLAAAWLLDDTNPEPNRFAKRNRQVLNVPVIGETYLLHIRETIEAVEVQLRVSSAGPGALGLWVGVQAPSQFGAVPDSWFLPVQVQPHKIPRSVLPCGDVRGQASGNPVDVQLALVARSDVPT